MATPHLDPYQKAQETRRRVLEMAVLMKRDEAESASPASGRAAAPGYAVDMYLALLQDRLPVWLRVLDGLMYLVGRGRVADNLFPIARAGIDYYSEIQSAALPAFTSPTVTVRFREAMRDSELGPMAEVIPLSEYLAAEQRAGRVAPEVDPVASARLLLAGCFHHAYHEMFVGADHLPSRDDSAEEIIRELRLEPRRA
ncbi:hypothetical protein FHS43_005085 [Streptosporangium becharense]|uniref:TetR family transcriptional regulator n=1 Tax=Streptosporangium becharense TaxID=1816182 RepID=A0A7W9MED1_9ACTN|nr:hypothetical protein [Streptosporangium becharense]MBB2913776.1 hypothetical protein [Streptosporangium becharense]MBB5817857.1 hypothetical protein [Streptosporangium becharense]